MIEFNQESDLIENFLTNPQMADWSNQTSSSSNHFSDEIDRIMKHEHEDVILLDDPLYVTPLDFDLDISDLLENQSSPVASSFSQLLNLNDFAATPTPFTNVNDTDCRSTTTVTSGYSSSDRSPKFTTLSTDSNRFQQFIPSNNLNLPSCVQQQQESSILGRSYPFEIQSHTDGPSDVKRFRSASMNDGPMLQRQNKLDPQLFDSWRLKSSNYINPPTLYQNESTLTANVSSNSLWPLVNCARTVTNSLSEVENQEEQLQSNHRFSSGSFNGSPNGHVCNQTRLPSEINVQSQTLYSINQSSKDDTTLSVRKRVSLVDFPVPEIKDDPKTPIGTIEQHSETDLWSDIEQNSCDHIPDDDKQSEEDDDDEEEEEKEINSSLLTRKLSETHSSSSSSRFWQYNVQLKGPKTKRILYLKERDPHLHREFSDPVYQIKLTQTKGQTFNKLRKGDGNDVTPNPMKLYQLGKQICDLSNSSSSVYHGIYHVEHHINTNDTAEVKKQKNKIASRACRLRKKAQHEANKLKLEGLNEEHRSLTDIIALIKSVILRRYRDGQPNSESLASNESLATILNDLLAKKYRQSVAGNTDGFVQAIISDMERLYAVKEKRSHSLKV